MMICCAFLSLQLLVVVSVIIVPMVVTLARSCRATAIIAIVGVAGGPAYAAITTFLRNLNEIGGCHWSSSSGWLSFLKGGDVGGIFVVHLCCSP